MKRGVTILNWQRKCILTTLLVLSSLFLVFSTITYASERDFKDSLKITTHNVYFLPTAIYPNWGQSQRADLISKADYIQNQDVVILNELFDKKASKRLLTRLHSQYPIKHLSLVRVQKVGKILLVLIEKLKSKWWRWYCE